MVALARNPAPKKPTPPSKNRVRDFFPSPASAPGKPVSKPLIRNRKNGPPVRNRVRRSKWGKDLSGSLGGAGGVGGLLMLTDSGEDYLASYDGNGNLMALTKASDGTMAAMYEYSPYGKLLRAEGPMAAKNPFRFSTKYLDTETGLYDYGLRFYDPEQGRFINRDPIEEQGGLNLYQAFGNDPINSIDVLGMYTVEMEIGGLSAFLGGNKDKGQWEPYYVVERDEVTGNGYINYINDGNGGRTGGRGLKSQHRVEAPRWEANPFRWEANPFRWVANSFRWVEERFLVPLEGY